MARLDVKPCARCGGAGEEYRPELRCSDGPWVDCVGCHGYGFAQSDESLRHCAAILGESWRVGWPQIFRGDVEYHDMRELCDRDAARPFAWLLRSTGSTLLLPDDMAEYRRDVRHALNVCADVIRAQDSDTRLYWWDGRTLRAVASAEELIARMRDAMAPDAHAAMED
jgi:hypothetical protein